MTELVIHVLEAMQVENDERELVRIADRPVEFFLKIVVEKAPVIKACQGIRSGIDLKLTQLFVSVISICAIERKNRSKNCPRLERSSVSSVSVKSSRKDSSADQRGGL